MPDSKRAWPDYLDLESKVSGLCLMNISINHPGCPWNNYLAEPTAAGKRLAGDTERLYEQPRRYARCCCRLPRLRSWLVLCNRCLFMPPRGCFSRYLTFLRCRCPGELTSTSEAHEQNLPEVSVATALGEVQTRSSSGPCSVSAALSWSLSCSCIPMRM